MNEQTSLSVDHDRNFINICGYFWGRFSLIIFINFYDSRNIFKGFIIRDDVIGGIFL